MVRGIYIPADSNEPLEVREFNGLEDYQQAVEGWVEPVDVPDLGITIYVNEEGLLRHLPFNSRATFLWWHHVPASRQSAMLVGNAVIVGMPDEHGGTPDTPTEVVELLTAPGPFAVLVKVGGDPAWYTDPMSKLSSVVMPLVSGEPTWYLSSARYEDYFSAAVWAMVLLERWHEATATRVAPVAQLASGHQHFVRIHP